MSHRYCSWCCQITNPTIVKNCFPENSILECDRCGKRIAKCMACQNYAKWDEVTVVEQGRERRKKVNHSFCAEHQHAIANFATADACIEEPSDYLTVYDYKQPNLARLSRVGGITLASAAILGPLSCHAAPMIGSALGSAMGYSGAVATRVGLATLGGGALTAGGTAIAGGTLVVTAVGASLGGALGAYIGSAYLGSIKDFSITKVRGGRDPALITLSGFLSQKNEGSAGWQTAADRHFREHAWYHVEWEAKSLADLGEFASDHARSATLSNILSSTAETASRAARKAFGPAATVYQILQLSRNPWHVALVKSEQTGVLLADILKRCKGSFILLGHSLGCRVIAGCLQALSTTDYNGIKQVHLLGGSVDKNREMWAQAAKAVDGPIRNYMSDHDMVLRTLYKVGSFFTSKPIGTHSIEVPEVENLDVSQHVDGHMAFKKNAASLLVVSS